MATETAAQRVARIVAEVRSGQRTLSSVRQSVDRLAGRQPGDYAGVNDAAWMGNDELLAQRVRSIFSNRGVSLTFYGNGNAPDRDDERDEQGRRDAFALVNNQLRELGLESMAPQVQQWITDGLSASEALLRLYQSPEFNQLFPEIGQRRQRGLPTVSAGQIIAYRREARGLMRAAGLSDGFITNDLIGEQIVNDRSISELAEILNDLYGYVRNADPAVRQWFAQQYGVQGDAALAMVYLDPDRAKAELKRMTEAAAVGGTGQRFGVLLTRARAEQLVGVGADRTNAQRGFVQLDEMAPLFSETISERDDYTAEGIGVDAVFGVSGGASRTLDERRQRRYADVRGGGGARVSQTGVIGAGEAS